MTPGSSVGAKPSTPYILIKMNKFVRMKSMYRIKTNDRYSYLIFLVPIHDTANEGWNQGAPCLGTCDRLSNGEDECQVAGNTLLLQDLGGLDSFPSCGNLDEDAGLVNASFLVQVNDLSCLGNRGIGVEWKTSINLSGNISWNNLGDLNTKVDGYLVLKFHNVVWREWFSG